MQKKKTWLTWGPTLCSLRMGQRFVKKQRWVSAGIGPNQSGPEEEPQKKRCGGCASVLEQGRGSDSEGSFCCEESGRSYRNEHRVWQLQYMNFHVHVVLSSDRRRGELFQGSGHDHEGDMLM